MTTIERDLKSLVENYAKYDQGKGRYLVVLNNEQRIRLEGAFSKLLYNCLLQSGPNKEQIGNNYLGLVPYFDAKNENPLSPEVLWIEHNLSKGSNDGVCLRTLSDCYQRLMTPEKFKDIQFGEIVSVADLKRWITLSKERSKTASGRKLYESLLRLVDQTTEYLDEMGNIKPKGVKILLSFLPAILVGLGTIVVVEELFAIYALYFVLLKGGQYIGSSNKSELKALGNTMQDLSVVTATTTTTILVRLVEMIFWSSHKCYSGSLSASSALMSTLIVLNQPKTTTLEEDLRKASENREPGIGIKDHKLRIIASPLEARSGQLGAQSFLTFRRGNMKFHAMEKFLFEMRALDQTQGSTESKLDKVKELLEEVKRNKQVYTKETAKAVDMSEGFLHFLIEHPDALEEKQFEHPEAESASLNKID